MNVIASAAKQPGASRGTPGCFATLAMTDEPDKSARWYGLVLCHRSPIVIGERSDAYDVLNVDWP